VAVEPYYDDGRVVIYHGDALELLPVLEADSVITDPPYGTGHYATDTACFTGEVLRTLVAIGPCAVFGWPEKLIGLCVEAGLTPDEWVTWWPTNGAMKGFNPAGLLREVECVASFGAGSWTDLRGVRTGNGSRVAAASYDGLTTRISGDRTEDRRMGDVWTDAAPGLGFLSYLRQHPNEKPMPVLHRLVEAVGVGTILDPFCGSGSTGVAALQEGMNFIGIEKEAKYVEIARRRIAAEAAQGKLEFT